MTGYESKRAAAQDKLAQESVVERAWFTIDELNAWADKKLVENPHWVMPAEEPERKEALAQPAQEPVAWANPNDLQNFDMKVRTNGGPLHTVPLYTTPPQRKPLTWERVLEIGLECANDHSRLPYEVKVARAIEAAHGIKEQS